MVGEVFDFEGVFVINNFIKLLIDKRQLVC